MEIITLMNRILLLLMAWLLLVACTADDEDDGDGALILLSTATAQPEATQTPTPSAPDRPEPPARTVMVHLFEWTWPDIARECETFLGPAGFVAVQVSPPQEHVVLSEQPWWQRYQPVSYQLISRSGDRAQFAEMVERCAAAGVDVYVDAVINHMSGMESGVGSAGTVFSHYEYPGLYTYEDFHHCGTRFDDIHNYQDPDEVRSCELLNLADLDQSQADVRADIVAYLNDLVGLGVAGFRLDAAKHMYPTDIAAILEALDGDPYIFQEVIDLGGEPITAAAYTALGDVTEFRYGRELARAFQAGRLAELETFGAAWGFLPSTEAVVFVDNHDNQRGHGGAGLILTHEDGALYELAVVYMLGWPYGYPRVMSSYAFTDTDAGPPSLDDGQTDPVYDTASAVDSDETASDCFDGWVCEHRWGPIAGMVGFHNFTSPNFFVTDWWTNGDDQIAFGRGELGFVVINREDGELSHTFQTSMPAGVYCNVIEGALADGNSCSGPTITVDDTGQAAITVPPMRAAAMHVGARLP